MEVIRECSMKEYSRHFWRRQASKRDWHDRDALADIEIGGDPTWWLWTRYPYKLPRPDNHILRIARLDKTEVLTLCIESHTVDDHWMQLHDLVPKPRTRVLGELAKIALDRGFFTGKWDVPQVKLYGEWQATLKDVLAGEEKVLVQSIGPEQYEIVDGWGRLLPFAALLIEGCEFHPLECFVASSS